MSIQATIANLMKLWKLLDLDGKFLMRSANQNINKSQFPKNKKIQLIFQKIVIKISAVLEATVIWALKIFQNLLFKLIIREYFQIFQMNYRIKNQEVI